MESFISSWLFWVLAVAIVGLSILFAKLINKGKKPDWLKLWMKTATKKDKIVAKKLPFGYYLIEDWCQNYFRLIKIPEEDIKSKINRDGRHAITKEDTTSYIKVIWRINPKDPPSIEFRKNILLKVTKGNLESFLPEIKKLKTPFFVG